MRYLAPILLLLAACTSKMMTMEDYATVSVGDSCEEVVKIAGKPYRTQKNKDGSIEYEYVEKLTNGLRTIEERTYIITIKDGRVVGKRVKQQSEAPYNINSYDLQTTSGNDVSDNSKE